MPRPEDLYPTESFEIDLAAIQQAAGGLRGQAGVVRDTGVQVDKQWQGLRPHYRAPESELLLGAPGRPRAESEVIAKDLERVAAILEEFVLEAGPLTKRMRAPGSALDWDLNDAIHPGGVTREGGAVDELRNTRLQLEAAERLAADKISQVYGGTRQGPAGDGSPLTVPDGERIDTVEVPVAVPIRAGGPNADASVSVAESRSAPAVEAEDDGTFRRMVAIALATGVAAGVSNGADKLGPRKKGSVDGGVSASRAVSQQVVVSEEDAERIRRGELAMPTPYDYRSIPVGASISITEEQGEEAAISGDGTAARVPVTGGASTGEATRETATVKRTDDDTVVVSTTTETAASTEGEGGVGTGDVNVGLSGSGEIARKHTESVEIDLSTAAGRAAYDHFLHTGELPPEQADVVSGKTVSEARGTSPDLRIGAQIFGASTSTSIAGDNAGTEQSIETGPDGTVKRSSRLNEVTTIDEVAPDGTHSYQLVLPGVGESEAEQLEWLRTGRDTDLSGDQNMLIEFDQAQIMDLRDQARAVKDHPDFGNATGLARGLAFSLADAETPRDVLQVLQDQSMGSGAGLVDMLQQYGKGAGYALGQRGSGDGTPIIPADRVGA
jgi:hypothetical protein